MTEPADTIINAKELRATLKEVVEGVHSGRRYTVLYRSRPAFRIGPVGYRYSIHLQSGSFCLPDSQETESLPDPRPKL